MLLSAVPVSPKVNISYNLYSIPVFSQYLYSTRQETSSSTHTGTTHTGTNSVTVPVFLCLSPLRQGFSACCSRRVILGMLIGCVICICIAVLHPGLGDGSWVVSQAHNVTRLTDWCLAHNGAPDA